MGVKETKARCDRVLYERKKNALLDAIGRECIRCGSTEGIEFDHVDRSTKSFSVLTEWKRPLDELLEEVRKCQPLCKVCHQSKTSMEMGVPHGGGVSGKRGCKCAGCRARKAEYAARYRDGEPRLPPVERLKTLHGTRAGYLLEGRLNLPRCAACRRANSLYTNGLREKPS